jgi:hypothetical protein
MKSLVIGLVLCFSLTQFVFSGDSRKKLPSKKKDSVYGDNWEKMDEEFDEKKKKSKKHKK